MKVTFGIFELVDDQLIKVGECDKPDLAIEQIQAEAKGSKAVIQIITYPESK